MFGILNDSVSVVCLGKSKWFQVVYVWFMGVLRTILNNYHFGLGSVIVDLCLLFCGRYRKQIDVDISHILNRVIIREP